MTEPFAYIAQARTDYTQAVFGGAPEAALDRLAVAHYQTARSLCMCMRPARHPVVDEWCLSPRHRRVHAPPINPQEAAP
jgi:hypothetical protein